MATLMEKDALLNGVGQVIASLSCLLLDVYESSNKELENDISELVIYRNYLYSTPSELVDFGKGKSLLQDSRKKYERELNHEE